MDAVTVEIRWFKKGEIPQIVMDWYLSSIGSRLKQPRRTDYYHAETAGGKLGTKLREGMIEIKQFKNYEGQWSSSNGKFGSRLERWQKWSFNLSEEQETIPVVQGSKDWIAIEKNRWLCQYAIRGKEVTVAEVEGEISNGCTLELSEILHKNETWWSLCLEAFGRAEELVPAIHAVADKLALAELPLPLSGDDAASYPEWLEKILHK